MNEAVHEPPRMVLGTTEPSWLARLFKGARAKGPSFDLVLDRPTCLVGGCGSGFGSHVYADLVGQLLKGWDGAVIAIDDQIAGRYLADQVLAASSRKRVFRSFFSPTLLSQFPTWEPDELLEPIYPKANASNRGACLDSIRGTIAASGYVQLGGLVLTKLSEQSLAQVSTDLRAVAAACDEMSEVARPVVAINVSSFEHAKDWITAFASLCERRRVALVVLVHDVDGFSALTPDRWRWVLCKPCSKLPRADVPADVPADLSDPRLAYSWSAEEAGGYRRLILW